MRKTIFSGMLAATALVIATQTSNAQSAAAINVEVKLELKPVMSGGGPGEDPAQDPGDASGDNLVHFLYDNAGKYGSDQTITKHKQVSVTSSDPYQLTVRSTTPNFESTEGTDVISLDVLNISATPQEGDVNELPAVTLNANPQKIAQGGSEVNRRYDINYTIPTNQTLIAAPKKVYKADIVFTVSPQ